MPTRIALCALGASLLLAIGLFALSRRARSDSASKPMPSFFSKLFGGQKKADDVESPLDYDKLVILDAEDLAEQGMGSAYKDLLPELSEHVEHPARLEEFIDEKLGSYAIRCNGVEHIVYSPSLPGSDEQSWGRATHLFFKLVNDQLADAEVRFYAINGGNDLGGMFLTPAEVKAAQAALPKKSDWPYLPNSKADSPH
jgi:hypothetical protein